MDFTSNEWNEILQLANSCPYIDGPAVFDARTLANFVDIDLQFDDNHACNNISGLRMKRNLTV